MDGTQQGNKVRLAQSGARLSPPVFEDHVVGAQIVQAIVAQRTMTTETYDHGVRGLTVGRQFSSAARTPSRVVSWLRSSLT